MFNDDQKAHMRSLAAIPPEERCWCGWCPSGECNVPDPCPPDSTCAQKLALRQPCCGWTPHRPGTPQGHLAGCVLAGPAIGSLHVCRKSAGPGWAGETVEVVGVCVEKRTARVRETDTDPYENTLYETVVDWDDLVPEARS